jgi:hypothetical protein
MTGNKTNIVSSSSMTDFVILKSFNVTTNPPKISIIKKIIWQPRLELWVKYNTNGASNNNTSSCGGIFRNHNVVFLCGFAENTGLKYAFMAELCGAMRAIKIANSRNWQNLWLESDSKLVLMVFNSAAFGTLGIR